MGRSQIIPYLKSIANNERIIMISFEKSKNIKFYNINLIEKIFYKTIYFGSSINSQKIMEKLVKFMIYLKCFIIQYF